MNSAWRVATTGATLAMLGCIAACGSSTTGSSSSAGSSSSSAGQSSSGGSTANLDARTIVSQSAAAQLTGDSNIMQLAQASSANVSIYADTSATGNGAGVTVFVEKFPSGVNQALVQQAIQHAGGSGSNVGQISGLGDAGYKEVEANSATVAFVKGDTLVAIGATTQSRSGADLESALESLAHQVAGSL